MLPRAAWSTLLAIAIPACGDPSPGNPDPDSSSTAITTTDPDPSASTTDVADSSSTVLADSSTTQDATECTDPDAPTMREVGLQTDTGIIQGVWSTPAGCPPFATVLMHVGSGPTDRDGDSALIRGSNLGHLQLADALNAAGFATLRFDKRGVATSASALDDPSTLVIDDYIDDLVAWAELLRTDPDTVGALTLLGHSEGSLIATVAAQRADVDALISVSGAGRPFADVLLDQLAAQLEPSLLAQAEAILDALQQGQRVDDVPPALQSLLGPSVQGYLISLFARDPAQEFADVSVPAVVISGTADIQVPVAEGEVLVAAKPDATHVVIEGMTHVFKTDAQGQNAAYTDPTVPLADGFVDAVVAGSAR